MYSFPYFCFFFTLIDRFFMTQTVRKFSTIILNLLYETERQKNAQAITRHINATFIISCTERTFEQIVTSILLETLKSMFMVK